MKILITSALPYINGIKHLGNLVGSILPADVYARFNRQRGNEVLFICATDEHGTPAELAAQEQNMPVAAYCDRMHKVQADIYAQFDISFDEFGRSSHPDNHALTKHFSKKLEEHGLIEERSIRQLYSVDDKRYLPDRYVQGTCPHCGYERARGDQCESCTRVLDPTDLVNPRSAISGSTNLEIRETKHLFLKQSAMVEPLEKWIDSHTDWPDVVIGIAKKWLKEGLEDRCITRDLSWGVSVDRPGFEGKVYYVWFDAPIAYIATTKTWSDKAPNERNWRDWWCEGHDVRYYQFMAKDNVPFHTISFPATLIGSGENWKKVDQLKGLNWLTYYGGKFSTSQKRGIFTDAALEEFPSDYWRYWLMANIPESGDSSFSFEKFGEQVNKDLNGVLGNFVNRITKFCVANFGAHIPEGGSFGPHEEELVADLEALIKEYTDNLTVPEYRKAMASLRAIWVKGNNYLAAAAPWTSIKTDKDAAAVATRVALNLCRLFAVLSAPIIPATAAKILKAFGEETAVPSWPTSVRVALDALKPKTPFEPIPVLFERIPPERIEALTEKYGGGESGPVA
ncbi:MAG: methionine--tRNA ligase [Alphaproteobacteria bacterium]|nr:methionine--tRNA ligase [Alphaproteobacteria bacterium]